MIEFASVFFMCIAVICMLGIYITFIVLLFKLLLGLIKYFQLKNALMSKELYKPKEVRPFDNEFSTIENE